MTYPARKHAEASVGLIEAGGPDLSEFRTAPMPNRFVSRYRPQSHRNSQHEGTETVFCSRIRQNAELFRTATEFSRIRLLVSHFTGLTPIRN